jgi:hypothetical protein
VPRQQYQCRFSEGGGEVSRRVGDSNHNIASADEGGQPINIEFIVDVSNAPNTNAGCCFQLRSLF